MIDQLASSLFSRIYGCWLGKSIGGTLGLPAEGRMERLHFSYYDPIPTIAPPNDDLELQLVWLQIVESSTNSLTREDFAQAWLNHIHYMWDEYGRCRWNLRRGVPVESVGTFENHFHAGMGSPIRSEIWGCLFPGDPGSAAHYAALDASLDHGREGIVGEVFFAVMQSEAAGGKRLQEAIDSALQYLAGDCETAGAIGFVRGCHREGKSEWRCWEELISRHGNENFTHAPLNVALTIWALLYGNSEFEKSILLAVNGGYDTDCTAATVGATLGFILGDSAIPQRWSQPIGESIFVGPGIRGITAPKTLTELTNRTLAQIGKLTPMRWEADSCAEPRPAVALDALPGTIMVNGLREATQVPWANGELPSTIKQAGGANWTWRSSSNEPRQVVFLAREGGRLFVNDKLALECPAGLPYVPATHRSPRGSVIRIQPGAGTHHVRVELNSRNSTQEASLLLAYPNMHICPWTAEELPQAAELPAPVIRD